ncbi:extracellular solute-binding protein [Nocardioides fonticola]|uniref:extracellular solute-binding protein n=1 Tax=Nocardioides fonticola TaxID=450363 RepID=UPI0031DFB6CE
MDRRVVVGVLAAAVLALAGCSDDTEPVSAPTAPSTSTSPAPLPKVDLTLGVYGTPDEVAAYQSMVRAYNAVSDNSTVTVKAWRDRDELVDYLRHADDEHPVPDVFLASRSDLTFLQENGLNKPVDELLDERNVDFGDGYSRDAIEGFSDDRKLQCMPYAVSPTVAYYNTDLVDFAKMAKRGLPAPSEPYTRWNLEQFTAAVTFAARPRTGAAGVAVSPTLDGLAPFVLAGGGSVFGDGTPPTSLALSSDDSRAALGQILPILRDPQLTLTSAQLRAASPLRWFERGKVGVIFGPRSLVPALRGVEGLRFDVLPVPSISTSATTGDVIGMCLSARTPNTVEAADFLAFASSPDAVRMVTRTGYLVPTNQQVALSDDFLQPTLMPMHASVFNSAVRTMVLPPFLDDYATLDERVAGLVRRLVLSPGTLDLDGLTQRIDERSQQVLAPPTPSVSPSPSPSE